MHLARIFAASVAGLYTSTALFAAAVSWDGEAGDFNWGNPQNWSNNLVPTSDDDVTFSATGISANAIIQLGGDRQVKSITFASGVPNFSLDDVGSTHTLIVSEGKITSSSSNTINVRSKVSIPGSVATVTHTSNGVVRYNNNFSFTGTLNYIGTGSFGRQTFLADNSATLNADIVFNGGNSGELDLDAPSFMGLGTGVGKTFKWAGGINTTLRPLNGLGTQTFAFDVYLGSENGGNHTVRVDGNSGLIMSGNISGPGNLAKGADQLGRLILTGDNRGWTGTLTVRSAGGGITLATVFNDAGTPFQRSTIADGKYSLGAGNVVIEKNGSLIVMQDTILYGGLTINKGSSAFGTGDGNGQILVADGKMLTVESLIINGIVFPNGTYSRNSVYNGIVLADYWPTSTVNGFTLGTGLIKVPEPTCALLLAALPLLRRRRA
jgi:hypothetical protein